MRRAATTSADRHHPGLPLTLLAELGVDQRSALTNGERGRNNTAGTTSPASLASGTSAVLVEIDLTLAGASGLGACSAR